MPRPRRQWEETRGRGTLRQSTMKLDELVSSGHQRAETPRRAATTRLLSSRRSVTSPISLPSG